MHVHHIIIVVQIVLMNAINCYIMHGDQTSYTCICICIEFCCNVHSHTLLIHFQPLYKQASAWVECVTIATHASTTCFTYRHNPIGIVILQICLHVSVQGRSKWFCLVIHLS